MRYETAAYIEYLTNFCPPTNIKCKILVKLNFILVRDYNRGGRQLVGALIKLLINNRTQTATKQRVLSPR